MHRKKIFIITLFLIIFISIISVNSNAQGELVVQNLSSKNRKIIREKLVNGLIEDFREHQVFTRIQKYMVIKSEELHQSQPLKLPDVLISDTFNKTEALFEHTKGFIGSNFVNSYQPEQIEKTVRKFLWLKGIGFFVLGIDDQHKMAFSYFYLPGNEAVKTDLLKDIVHYSFPEVPRVSQNKIWYDEMAMVMDRLGYNIFNVDKYGL